MEPLYNFLGLSVGVIVADLQPFERQTAYGADITYGTNNEFGFDYLRDNMVTDQYDKVQRELNFCRCRRSGLHSDRRSAYAADYFRPGR